MVDVSTSFRPPAHLRLTVSISYRHQLELFVDKVKGREPRTWMSAEESVANIEWIEKVYEKVSLRDCARE